MEDTIRLEDIPNFDHKKNFLEPSVYLKYFENVAEIKKWTDQEKGVKLISKVDEALQIRLLEVFHLGYNGIRKKFLETKLESIDSIGILEKKYNAEQDLITFISEKKKAAKYFAQKTSDELYIESVRRSLPPEYQSWIKTVYDIERLLPEKLKEDNSIVSKINRDKNNLIQKEEYYNHRFELLSKAYEFSKKYNCDIAMLIFDENGKLSQYASKNLDKTLMNYVNYNEACKENYTNKDIETALMMKKLFEKNEKIDQKETSLESSSSSSFGIKIDKNLKTSIKSSNTENKSNQTSKVNLIQCIDEINRQINDLNLNDCSKTNTQGNHIDKNYYKLILNECLTLLNSKMIDDNENSNKQKPPKEENELPYESDDSFEIILSNQIN